VSVTGLVLFLGGVFGLRMLGGFGLGSLLSNNPRWERLLALLPLSIVAAVIAVQTFTTRRSIVFDARVVGIAVAAFAAWRRWPLAVVVLLAALTTALVRQTGWG
jgi:Branched-chain amino acid transport protein (AzlD)